MATAAVKEALRSLKTGRWVAVGERVVVTVGGAAVVLRVGRTRVLEAKEEAETVGHHCYRGMLTADTDVRVVEGGVGMEGERVVR